MVLLVLPAAAHGLLRLLRLLLRTAATGDDAVALVRVRSAAGGAESAAASGQTL
jgi:hypothetical protein